MNVRQVIPRDAIPSVDEPTFGTEHEPADDEVILVEGSPPRAYPVRYLHYHEIVNDAIDGRPVAVTWCPLCGSAVVYDRRVAGRRLTFGVSGKLADDDLVMYDRETESEWKQSLGRAIAGPLDGEALQVVPAAVIPWREARDRGAVVLEPPGGKSEASGPGDEPEPVEYDADPYEAYFESEGFGLGAHRGGGGREWDREDLDPKAVVLGIERDGEAVGFVRERVLDAGGLVEATVGDESVLVVAGDEGVHAYANPGLDFERDGDVPRADGTEWDPATGESDDGRRLRRLPARRLFAFAWQDDHGPDAFHEPGSDAV